MSGKPIDPPESPFADLSLTPEEEEFVDGLVSGTKAPPPAVKPLTYNHILQNMMASLQGVVGEHVITWRTPIFGDKPEKMTEETLFRSIKRFRKNLSKRKYKCSTAFEKWQELRHHVDTLRTVYESDPKWEVRHADLEKQVMLIKKKLGYMANNGTKKLR